MLTGKQRSFLKNLAQKEEVALIIGKNGITENVIAQLEQVLEKRELVKVKFLDTAIGDREEMIEEVLESLQAEFVQFIGSKFIMYRPSKKPKIELPK